MARMANVCRDGAVTTSGASFWSIWNMHDIHIVSFVFVVRRSLNFWGAAQKGSPNVDSAAILIVGRLNEYEMLLI